MSFLMKVYEKNESQRKASLGQQPRNAKPDQDLGNAGGSDTSRKWCDDSSREWCDDPDAPAYSPPARRNAKQDQDLNANGRSIASREWCDDAELEAPKEPCRDSNQDIVMDSAVSGGMDSSQTAAYPPVTHQHQNAKRDQDVNGKSPEVSREWCDGGGNLEAQERWYPEKYADQDMIMKSAMIGEDESVSSQAAVVTPMNRRPGAYAVGLGRRMQHRHDDAGTTTATVNPTTVVSEEFPPIAAEVAEDTTTDVSLHIRRILAENAVRASSVVELDESKEFADKSAPAQGESSRRWRRLILVFLCLILLAVAAAVSVVVVMLTKDPQPTTRITIVIKLDDHPEETGWELNQGSEEVVAYPPGTYRGDNSKEIVTKTDVYAGEEYTFTLYDTGGNGIDGGYYKIYDAPDTSDPSTVLVEGSGNFTDQVHEDFAPVGQETNEEDVDLELQGDEKECIDCEVTDWSDWSPCSADCNGGTRSRTRTVMIPGNECGNPCPSFIETEPCNTGPCPDECPHECCGDNDCQQDEKCLNNECKPVCECNCPEMYTCNVDANCQCICPYECCKDDDCTGANQMCSSDYTCIPKPTDPSPCECGCSPPYTCIVEANCECSCPYECCQDVDCAGENQICSGDYSCIPIPTDTSLCECGCSPPYTCIVEANCECSCPYECCQDLDCAVETQMCSGDYSCIPIPTDTSLCECACTLPYTCNVEANCTCICSLECCSDDDCTIWEECFNNECLCDTRRFQCCEDSDCCIEDKCDSLCLDNICVPIEEPCDCPSPYTCNDNGECICPSPYECCSNDECINGWECSDNNECNPICDCYSPYTCNDVGECICEYQCCSNDDCDNGYECLNNVCNCPYDCCSDGDCGDVWEWECLNNACNPICDCYSPYTCNDVGDCICDYECCSNDDCGNGYECLNNECTEVCPYECCDDGDCGSSEVCVSNECKVVCECACSSPYNCNADCECECPHECCEDSDCSGDEYCDSDYTCYYDSPA